MVSENEQDINKLMEGEKNIENLVNANNNTVDRLAKIEEQNSELIEKIKNQEGKNVANLAKENKNMVDQISKQHSSLFKTLENIQNKNITQVKEILQKEQNKISLSIGEKLKSEKFKSEYRQNKYEENLKVRLQSCQNKYEERIKKIDENFQNFKKVKMKILMNNFHKKEEHFISQIFDLNQTLKVFQNNYEKKSKICDNHSKIMEEKLTKQELFYKKDIQKLCKVLKKEQKEKIELVDIETNHKLNFQELKKFYEEKLAILLEELKTKSDNLQNQTQNLENMEKQWNSQMAQNKRIQERTKILTTNFKSTHEKQNESLSELQNLIIEYEKENYNLETNSRNNQEVFKNEKTKLIKERKDLEHLLTSEEEKFDTKMEELETNKNNTIEESDLIIEELETQLNAEKLKNKKEITQLEKHLEEYTNILYPKKEKEVDNAANNESASSGCW